MLISSASWAQILNQQTTLTESRFDDTVVFVTDVAMDGDTVVAVGGDWECKRSTVRVFDQVDGVWKLKHYLHTENDHARRVAMDGDTVVVETLKSAYVFTRIGRRWTKQAELTWDFNGNSLSRNSVAIDGDTVVVGFSNSSGQEPRYGSAYVFTRTEKTWTKQATLTSGAPDDLFGSSVAIDGDTIVVGTKSQGSAYVFSRFDGVWTQQAELSVSKDFGYSVAIDGDTIVVGDIEVDPPDPECKTGRCISCAAANSRCGSVYVFTKTGTSWIQQAKLTAADDDFDDLFGTSVAIDGDTIVVGTRGFPSYEYSSGSAYVFSRSGETWTKRAKLSPDFVQSHMNWNVITQVAVADGIAVTGNRYGAFFFITEGQW